MKMSDDHMETGGAATSVWDVTAVAVKGEQHTCADGRIG